MVEPQLLGIPRIKMSDNKSQASGDLATGASVAPSGGVGMEKTPASSDTPNNTSGSTVCVRVVLF